MRIRNTILFAFAVTAALPCAVVDAAELTVEVAGIASDRGTLAICLFGTDEGFPRESEQAAFSRRIKTDQTRLTFADLPNTTYAVVVHHDLNNNGKVDKSVFGIPTEPIGLSRYTSISLSNLPAFRKAAVNVVETSTVRVPLLDLSK